MSEIKVHKKAKRKFKFDFNATITLLMLIFAMSGCSRQAINQALFSMGEQANCARTNDNRVDEHSRRATCLADSSLNPDYANYKKAREDELAK